MKENNTNNFKKNYTIKIPVNMHKNAKNMDHLEENKI